MSHQTKVAAERAGKAALKTMPKGWRLRVWENLGWHFSILNGPAAIYESSVDGSFNCLISDDPKATGWGGVGWSGGGDRSAATPIEAYCLEVENFKAYFNKLKEIHEAILDALPLVPTKAGAA